jgi:hypothetical protein
MATFKITRITNPISYWEEFCQNVREIDKLPNSAIEAVETNTSKILELLNETKSVLVFGQVQSGKTLNYSGLIAQTLESKYDLVIVLAGTKTNLVDQTYERLNSYFNSSPDIDILKMNNDVNFRQQLNKINDNQKRKLILVSLKHQDYLQKIGFELHLNAVRTLVLDDEADQASLNTKEYYSHKNNINEMSRIYSELKSILNSDFVNLIQYTATPQALFLLGTDNVLCPEKYYVQHPPDSYFGINELLHSTRNHIVPVLDFESSYKFVIDEYIKICYQLISNENYNETLSCLIHSDWRTNILDQDYQKVNDYIRNYTFNRPDWNELANDKLPIDQFENWFRGNICIYDVFRSKTEVEWDKYQFIILVGGNMLERGFTIPGLVSTILTRNSKSASNSDTLQQRCRFLGYRDKLKDYIKVYTTQEIIDDLKDYDNSQNLMLSEIDESGFTANFSKSFIMKYLLPTRQNVLPGSLKRSIRNKNLILNKRVNSYDEISIYINKHNLNDSQLSNIRIDNLSEVFIPFSNHPILKELEEIPVALFGKPNNPRLRTFNEFGRVNELFQGRSNKYLGDRYLFGETLHLQIHLVKDKINGQLHIYFAIMNGPKLDIVYLDYAI